MEKGHLNEQVNIRLDKKRTKWSVLKPKRNEIILSPQLLRNIRVEAVADIFDFERISRVALHR